MLNKKQIKLEKQKKGYLERRKERLEVVKKNKELVEQGSKIKNKDRKDIIESKEWRLGKYNTIYANYVLEYKKFKDNTIYLALLKNNEVVSLGLEIEKYNNDLKDKLPALKEEVKKANSNLNYTEEERNLLEKKERELRELVFTLEDLLYTEVYKDRLFILKHYKS